MSPAPGDFALSAERITVLGGAGFIGSHLLRHLQRAGHETFSPGRGDQRVFTEPLGHVVYSIGLTADFRTRPLETIEAHVCILRRILAEAHFTSLTYLSSTRVYAGAASTSEEANLRVNPLDPGSLYNLSKLTGEALCLHCGRPGIKVARLSNVVGLRSDSDMFVNQLVDIGLAQGHVELHTALTARKDYLYVDDAVGLLEAMATSPVEGIFNVASGEGVDNGQIVRQLEKRLGFTTSVAADAPTTEYLPVDISRARATFGFAPSRFADYFPKFIDLYKQKKGL